MEPVVKLSEAEPSRAQLDEVANLVSRDKLLDEALEHVRRAHEHLETLILKTPTGDIRVSLCDANIHALISLRALYRLSVVGVSREVPR